MKCKTRAEAVARYGHIDLASAYWPDKNKWIKMFEVPVGWFPNWRVLDTHYVVKHIACNIDTHKPLLAALQSVHDKNLGHVLKTFDGCFNIRKVRGSAAMSTHSYGLGFDFNASLNPLGSLSGDFGKHPEFIKCFKDQGFDWGGDWSGRKDFMHLSWAWE